LVLARLASKQLSSLVTLASSAPVRSTEPAGELTAAVEAERGACIFVAASREGAGRRVVFMGPSLTVACSTADQVLEAVASLESPIRPREEHLARRTRPQYLRKVHCCEALGRLGALAAGDEAFASGRTGGAS
jgi:hypothetical protein